MAHRQGLTLSGYQYVRAGGARSLAERTQRSLQKQATRELSRAYAPVERELSRRDQQARSLDAKRAADEEVFKSWLNNTQAQLRSDAERQDQELRALAAKNRDELKTRLDTILQSTPGFGGAQAAQPAAVAAAATAATARGAAADTALLGRQSAGSDLLAATSANNLAYAASLTAKRQAQTLKSLADNADERTKAVLARAGDEQKRLGQLLDNEMQKAQARIAAQQFGAKLEQDEIQDVRSNRTKRAGQRITRLNKLSEVEQRRADRAARREDARLNRELKRELGKDGGSRAGGITPEKRALANQAKDSALNTARKKGMSRKPGQAYKVRRRLMNQGYSPAIATVAAFQYVYNARIGASKAASRAWQQALRTGGK